MICEWQDCAREATVMRAWGDTLVCHGHDIIADANAATWGDYGIGVDEYRAHVAKAMKWLAENPA